MKRAAVFMLLAMASPAITAPVVTAPSARSTCAKTLPFRVALRAEDIAKLCVKPLRMTLTPTPKKVRRERK